MKTISGFTFFTKYRRRLIFGAILAAAFGLRIAFFIISVMNVSPSSDESITMLLAGNIINSRFPLLFMAQPYMFPLESYIVAPFVNLLPPNAFGARLIPLMLCLSTVFVSLVIVKKSASVLSPWVAALLILFPSSYVLTLQSAYALPGYTVLPLLGAIGVMLALYQRERSSVVLAFAAGLITALNSSVSLLALPFLIFTASYVCFGVNWRSTLKNSAFFLSGGAVGALPFLIVSLTIPGAHGVVISRYSALEAWQRLWTPTFTHALSPVLGSRICLFPDGDVISLLDLSIHFYGVIFAGILIAVVMMRLYALRRIIPEKRFRLELQDLIIGVILCALTEFIFAKRADSQSYRYLIVCAWSFPFVIAFLHKSVGPVIRCILSMLVILITGLNIVSTVVLANKWRMPNFPEKVGLADLTPVLRRLDELGVKHAVASHGVAYRIMYLSGGKVICSQPVNERFPGWSIPYKDVVDDKDDVVYVLTDKVRFLKPAIFDRHLKTMNVECIKEPCGDYFIYREFKNMMNLPGSRVLPSTNLSFSTSHNSEKACNMNDGSVDTVWMSVVPQEERMWVQIDLASMENINGLQLEYGQYGHDIAGRTDVDLLTDRGWVTVVTNMDNTCDKFVFQNNHPVYGPARQTILFPTLRAKAIRTTITKARPPFCWTAAEINVLTAP